MTHKAGSGAASLAAVLLFVVPSLAQTDYPKGIL